MRRRFQAATSAFFLSCTICPAVFAQSVTEVAVDVGVGGGYSANPFNEVGDDTGAAYGVVTVSPQVVYRTARDTVTLDGTVDLRAYESRYSVVDAYRAALSWNSRWSSRLSSTVSARYNNAVLGGLTAFTDPDGGVILPPIGEDIGLYGVRVRRENYSGSAGINYALSARDSLSLGGTAQAVRYGDGARSGLDHDSFGGNVGYQRQISEFVKVGVAGAVDAVSYTNDLYPDTNTYSAFATFDARLSSLLTLSGKLGVSVLETKADGVDTRQNLAGSLNLCREGELSTLCIDASRDYAPSGLGGTRTQTSVGATYSSRLSEYSNVSLSTDYVKVDNEGLSGIGDSYLQSNASYSHRLTERLSLKVGAFHREIFGDSTGRSGDYGGELSLTYRFGDVQ
jgi:hypothetical protein